MKGCCFLCILTIATLLQNSESTSNRPVGFVSSCPRTGRTPWNSINVGIRLQQWIKSIQIINPHYLNETTIVLNERGDNIRLLARFDAKTRKFVGNSWKVEGPNIMPLLDGYFYGPLDSRSNITGDNVVYLYPDMKTALVGKFERSIMLEARAARVIAERCEDGIKAVKISKPKENAPIYKYQRPNQFQPGDQPKLMDPYEKRTIYVGQGVKEDGIFAKRDIKEGEIVAYYSGVIIDFVENPVVLPNMTMEERYHANMNLITLSSPNLVIDVPYHLWSIVNFRATLGHKLNHSFMHHQTRYLSPIYHPRYGPIVIVLAIKDIKKGEEVFCNYQYPLDDSLPPQLNWYKDVYFRETGIDLWAKN